ncbi:MAG TPA: hypothetical protein VE955_11840, partial [Candidatus Dormibacteraeota bacterium]|nr:hypothetical protein [Candidatus Dormibacteraeota bacterium]
AGDLVELLDIVQLRQRRDHLVHMGDSTKMSTKASRGAMIDPRWNRANSNSTIYRLLDRGSKVFRASRVDCHQDPLFR